MKVLIIDNFDSFTHNLAQLIEKTVGTNYCIIKNDSKKIDVHEFHKIIFSPGPGIPKEEAGLMQYILSNYQKTKSILGICLGHQAIAEFYGAKLINLTKVYHGIQSNINVIDPADSLFKNLPISIKGGLYHSWGVSNSNFPECLKITTISADGIIMGVSHKIYDIKGLQFHPESIMTDYGEMIIRNWLSK
ncbi:MAG TPA: aminodeoxychorismate/anthranilate synthase component II [Bacteroidales bacterium]|nr:aminodeoxychorismate/anthranilate synthase component II [Bacteroidales bacterium]